MTAIVTFIALVFVYSLVSERLGRTVITPPILFTCAGFLAFMFLPAIHDPSSKRDIFLHLAEIGLVLLLFTDASRTNLHVLKSIRSLPARLLSTGMLLTLLLGTLGALVVFRKLTVWEAGILGAILAPTDAGLGQIIVTSALVPMRVRQALNVEAGLNDGLSVPFLLFFLAWPHGDDAERGARLVRYIGEQLGLGTLIGAAVGLIGGWLLGVAHRRKWMAEPLQQLGVVAVALLCMLLSDPVGASMFIAAFVAGLAVQVGFRQAGKHSVEFTEQWGQLINLSVFFLFGLVVARDWRLFEWSHLLYAVLSLTVIRMLPVAIALIGTRLSAATVLFMGWFGPRGLASIVLGLVYLEHRTNSPVESTIRLAVMATVLLSILAHGLSAMPGIRLYAARVKRLDPGAPELLETSAQHGTHAARS